MAKMDLLAIREMDAKEINEIVKFAQELKKGKKKVSMPGKTLAMIFEKPSTRTRVSFEVAMSQLGGHAIYLDLPGTQLGMGETMADTARTLGRYVNAIMARVYKHADLAELAKHAEVPVINGLSDEEHPCQALGDLLTIMERGKTKGKIAFVGDPASAVANSFAHACAKMKLNLVFVCPPGYEPKVKGARVEHDLMKGVQGADVVYVGGWRDGEEESEEMNRAFVNYQLNAKALAKAKKDCVVMHALPAKRGVEITSDVLDGRNSAVWEQAENRLHVQKAVLARLLKK